MATFLDALLAAIIKVFLMSDLHLFFSSCPVSFTNIFWEQIEDLPLAHLHALDMVDLMELNVGFLRVSRGKGQALCLIADQI